MAKEPKMLFLKYTTFFFANIVVSSLKYQVIRKSVEEFQVLLTFDESSSVLLIFFNQSVQSDEAWKNLKKK